ncbi:MAG: hypothetical protein GEU73_00760 [Chloroflexi bacterium]|nr:hypothetical protein [Chloroflexota bacterium]
MALLPRLHTSLAANLLAFLVALQFLTRLPTPVRGEITTGDVSRSVAYFPAVGAIVGALLVAADLAASLLLTPAVTSALLVVVLVTVTGALHLDGLVDTFDGLAAEGDAEARLAAMRGGVAGVPGALAGCTVLLALFVALWALPTAARAPTLFLAPVAGRSAILLAYWAHPYARREATVSLALKQGATTFRALAGLAAACILAIAVAGIAGLALLVLSAAVMQVVAWFARAGISGLTGDVCGAICEMSQLSVVVIAPFVLRS